MSINVFVRAIDLGVKSAEVIIASNLDIGQTRTPPEKCGQNSLELLGLDGWEIFLPV